MFDFTAPGADLFAGLLLLLSILLFFLHALRTRAFAGPFVMFLGFLWFLGFLSGGFDYALVIESPFTAPLKIRFSSAVFTLIFVGILLVYVTEGVREAQNMIFVSLGAQLVLVACQYFLHHGADMLAGPEVRHIAYEFFEPSPRRMFAGIVAAALDLFFAITFFQFLVNRLPRWPLSVLLFLSLWATMILDSVLFIGGTRSHAFAATFRDHFIYKTLIVAALTGPLALYIRWFQKRGSLDLRRGSLDIFRRIEVLEEDLARANAELRDYAEHLEEKVEIRTTEIKEKQRILDMELSMAAAVQKAMLPGQSSLSASSLATGVLYQPCSTVSGDLYDLGMIAPELVFFFIGDISGHGVPAALVASMCKMSLSRIDLRATRPADVLERLSMSVSPISGDHYLTGVICIVDVKDRIMTYASGAHVSPLLVGPKGQRIDALPATGPVIGTTFSGDFTQKRVRYAPGTRMVLYTDGITEHRNPGAEEFGEERLRQVLTETRPAAPEAVTGAVVRATNTFGEQAPYRDDLTILVVDLP